MSLSEIYSNMVKATPPTRKRLLFLACIILSIIFTTIILYGSSSQLTGPKESPPSRNKIDFSNPDIDLIMKDPYIKQDPAPWVTFKEYSSADIAKGRCPKESVSTAKSRIGVITITSVQYNHLSHFGGTGHWYHFLQRILPSLVIAAQEIWGDDLQRKKAGIARSKLAATTSSHKQQQSSSSDYPTSFSSKISSNNSDTIYQYDDIYLLFHESSSVQKLNAFGRMILTSFLTGGRTKRIHFGYAESATVFNSRASSHSNVSNSMGSSDSYVKLAGMRILYTSDLEHQSIDDLFSQPAATSSSPAASNDGGYYPHLLHVPLLARRRKYQWFVSPEEYTLFRDSYQQTCRIPGTAAAASTASHLDSKSEKSSNQQSVLFDDMPAVLTMGDILHPAEYTSSTNPFRSIKTPSDGNIAGMIPPMITTFPLQQQSPIKVLIYQRNKRRKLVNVQDIHHWLDTSLNSVVDGPNRQQQQQPKQQQSSYEVVTLVHDEMHRSPCRLIQIFSTTSIYLTIHGFQSILALFQPLASLLVEIHPHLLPMPYFFGELQLALRQAWQIPRSYLYEESNWVRSGGEGQTAPVIKADEASGKKIQPAVSHSQASYWDRWTSSFSDSWSMFHTNLLLPLAVQFGVYTRKNCVLSKYCRSVTKEQDVRVSEKFVKERLSPFVKTYFVKEG